LLWRFFPISPFAFHDLTLLFTFFYHFCLSIYLPLGFHRSEVRQRVGHLLYGRLVDQSPQLYKRIFKTPFQLKTREDEYSLHSRKTHEKAREFIKDEGIEYLIMGHTHNPIGNDGKLFYGDMIDSFTYVIIENGKPRLERMSVYN